MSLIDTTHNLIQKFGSTDYSLRSVTSTGLVDPNFPSKGPAKSSVDYPILAFPAAYTKRQVASGVVKKGDIKLYVDPTGLVVVPTAEDKIIHSSGTLRVKDVIEYSEKGVAVLYILQVRK